MRRYLTLRLLRFDTCQLADYITTDLWATAALCTAISAAMFKLADTGFDDLKMLAVTNAAALLLGMDCKVSKDALMANKVQAIITILLLVLAFIK